MFLIVHCAKLREEVVYMEPSFHYCVFGSTCAFNVQRDWHFKAVFPPPNIDAPSRKK